MIIISKVSCTKTNRCAAIYYWIRYIKTSSFFSSCYSNMTMLCWHRNNFAFSAFYDNYYWQFAISSIFKSSKIMTRYLNDIKAFKMNSRISLQNKKSYKWVKHIPFITWYMNDHIDIFVLIPLCIFKRIVVIRIYVIGLQNVMCVICAV